MAINRAFEHDYGDVIDYKHCAVLVKGGSVLSIGYNKMATNGFMEHFANQVKGIRNWCISTHAECNAVYLSRNETDLTDTKIYVARIRAPGSPQGKVGLSRPCSICQHVLARYGVSRAYYTIADNEYGVMKIEKTYEY